MKINFILLVLLLTAVQTFGQGFQWVNHMGGPEPVRIFSSALDNSNNLYSTGYFRGTVNFNISKSPTTVLTATGGLDVFISKTDSSGALLWVKKIGSTNDEFVRDIAYDKRGFIYITGSFSGTVDFDPGPSVVNRTTANQASDSFLAKYDLNGNLIWVNTFGDIGGTIGYTVKVDKYGSVLTAGYFQGVVDFNPSSTATNSLSSFSNQPIYIAKYDSFGNYVWAKTITRNLNINNEKFSIDADSSNNIYFAATFEGTHDFDPGPNNVTVTANIFDVFVLKLDSLGDFIWVKKFGGNGRSITTGAKVVDSTSLVIAGFFYDTLDFGLNSGQSPLVSGGRSDGFIFKINLNGDLLWATQISGINSEEIRSIAVDNVENIYVSGDNFPSSFINKYDSFGNLIWNSQLSAAANSACYSSNVVVDNNQDIYTTGAFARTVDFDPSTGVNNLTSTRNISFTFDGFIQKMDSSARIATNLKETENLKSLLLQPNPATEYFTINTEYFIHNEKVRIYNLSGKLVLETVIETANYPINVSNLISGVYLVKVGDKFSRLIVE